MRGRRAASLRCRQGAGPRAFSCTVPRVLRRGTREPRSTDQGTEAWRGRPARERACWGSHAAAGLLDPSLLPPQSGLSGTRDAVSARAGGPRPRRLLRDRSHSRPSPRAFPGQASRHRPPVPPASVLRALCPRPLPPRTAQPHGSDSGSARRRQSHLPSHARAARSAVPPRRHRDRWGGHGVPYYGHHCRTGKPRLLELKSCARSRPR